MHSPDPPALGCTPSPRVCANTSPHRHLITKPPLLLLSSSSLLVSSLLFFCAPFVQVASCLDAVVSQGADEEKEEEDDDSNSKMIVWGTVFGVLLVALGFGAWFARCATRSQREARETGVHVWSPNLLGGFNPNANPQQQQHHHQQQQQQQAQYSPYPPVAQYPTPGHQVTGFPVTGQPMQPMQPTVGPPQPPPQHQPILFSATVQAPQAPPPKPP